ncbi:MAG TPA: tyrosine-type recombinase/integrase [Magnetospirillaceae bacterium]|jgi:integrase
MAKTIMLDTNYLFQPRGKNTAWLFRMATPAALVGQPNPRTGRPYGKEIRESLGRVTKLAEARQARDVRLGHIRLEELAVTGRSEGTVEEAMSIAASLRDMHDEGERETATSVLADQAEKLEKKVGTKKAVRWYKTATGERTPFGATVQQFKADRGKALSQSSLNNLDTAVKEFKEFAGEDVTMEEVTRRMAGQFVTQFLPDKKGPKAPDGQGPATIRKKVSQLTQVWSWAQQRGLLPYSKETPWDAQGPTAKEVKARAKTRRIFHPEETRKILSEAPEGKDLGDLIRVALLAGVRLEEVAGLKASQVDESGDWYNVMEGKTDNAIRVVPLVDMAKRVILARLSKASGPDDPLFPKRKVRKSSGKRGGSLSQAFTRLRRRVLGKHTDGVLVQHCFRHTWHTEARRADVDLRTIQEMGGWGIGGATDAPYDHGLEIKQYVKAQKKVAAWLRKKGYFE